MVSGSRFIRFLAKNYYPEQGGTAQLLTDITTALSDRFNISVVTGLPTYHEYDRERSVPNREVHAGVNIRRVRSTRFDKDVLPLRVVNWITFSTLVFIRLLFSRTKPQLHFVVTSPPTLPIVTWALHRIRGIPYVFAIHDMYPDLAVALGYIAEGGIAHRIWEYTSKATYRDAKCIIVLGEAMKQRLIEKMAHDTSFDPDKVLVVPSWEDHKTIQPKPKSESHFAEEYGTREKFTLLYAGNIGRYHELMTAVRSIEELEEEGRNDIQLMIVGEGARKQEVEDYVDSHAIENIKFAPIQPAEILNDMLNCADASLVAVQRGIKGICVPSKFYTSLAVGNPILGVAPEGDDIARVIADANCGTAIEPGEISQAKKTLERWANNPELTGELGQNARHYLIENYTLDKAARRYSDVFDELAA